MDTPAARLKVARMRKGIETATDAARQIGMKESTYQCFEGGLRPFTRHVVILARFYDVRPEWLEKGWPPMLPSELERKFIALSPDDQARALEYIDALAGNISNAGTREC